MDDFVDNFKSDGDLVGTADFLRGDFQRKVQELPFDVAVRNAINAAADDFADKIDETIQSAVED